MKKESKMMERFKEYKKEFAFQNALRKENAFKFGEKENGTEVFIGLEKLVNNLNTQCQILGPTGCGKSKLMEHLFREMVLKLPDASFVLLDPKGDLYREVLKFCLSHNHNELRERLVLFDPSEENVIGFNPLFAGSRNPAFVMYGVVSAIGAVWGQQTLNETPQLKRFLENTIYTLIRAGATFLETIDMLQIMDNWKRDYFVSKLNIDEETSRVIREEWVNFGKLSLPRRKDDTNSSLSRVRSFCLHPVIANILGRQNKTLDIGKITGEGKILLVNLERYRPLEPEQVYLLGTLLINDLVRTVFAKNENERKSCYLFIDEFEHFATRDLIPVLEEGRSFKLHLILAHQSLNQLKRKDEDIYDSVLTNARTKIIFGGLTNYDLEILASELYTQELNPYKVKDEIRSPVFEPVEERRAVLSYGKNESSSFGKNSSIGKNHEESEGNSFAFGQGENSSLTLSESTTETEMTGETEMRSKSRARGRSESDSAGEGQGLSSLHSTGQGVSLPQLFGEELGLETLTWNESNGSGSNLMRTSGRASGISEVEGESEGAARSRARSFGVQESEARTTGKSNNWNIGITKGTSEGITETDGTTEQTNFGKSESVSITPFHAYKKYDIVSSRTFQDIQEQLFEKVQFLKGMKQREFVVKFVDKEPLKLKTPFVAETKLMQSLTDNEAEKIKQEIFVRTGYYSTPEEIKTERQKQIEEWKKEYEVIEMEKQERETESSQKIWLKKKGK